jgi:hypothetical protein
LARHLNLEREPVHLAFARLIRAGSKGDIVTCARDLTIGLRAAIGARGEPEGSNNTDGNTN